MVSQHAHFLELGVIRTFEFVSALRRMSVVVKRLKSTSMEVYVKGAPEVMAEICDKSTCKFLRIIRGLSAAELCCAQSRLTMMTSFRTIPSVVTESSLWLARA